jgi:hypothetical protein
MKMLGARQSFNGCDPLIANGYSPRYARPLSMSID